MPTIVHIFVKPCLKYQNLGRNGLKRFFSALGWKAHTKKKKKNAKLAKRYSIAQH